MNLLAITDWPDAAIVISIVAAVLIYKLAKVWMGDF